MLLKLYHLNFESMKDQFTEEGRKQRSRVSHRREVRCLAASVSVAVVLYNALKQKRST